MVEDAENLGSYKPYEDEQVEIDDDKNLIIHTNEIYDIELYLKAMNLDQLDEQSFYIKIEAKVYNFPPYFVTGLPTKSIII